MITVTLATVLAVGLGLFQLALALGAPLGAYAWGGRTPGRLPRQQRLGSAVSVAVYVGVALVALGEAGVGPVRAPSWLLWSLAVLFAVGTVPNMLSRSRKERTVMTPVALALALSFFGIADAQPASRAADGAASASQLDATSRPA